jgi:molybdopterin-containing oxidoreductase family iron-sulfur binding subunit
MSIPSTSSLSYTGGAIDFSTLSKPSNKELEISFYEPVNVGNGQYAGNPWLQESPNPVDRTSWGNYLAVPVNFDGVRTMKGFNDLKDGDLVTLTINGQKYTVPVIQQFGQMQGTVSIALGYGRTDAGAAGNGVGINVNPHTTIVAGYPQNYSTDVTVSNSEGKEKYFSCVQYHHTIGVKGKDKETGEIINADEAATVFFDYFTGAKGFQGSLTDRSVIYTSNFKDVKANQDILAKKREHAQFLNSKNTRLVITGVCTSTLTLVLVVVLVP